jgi:subtilisin family serine protease
MKLPRIAASAGVCLLFLAAITTLLYPTVSAHKDEVRSSRFIVQLRDENIERRSRNEFASETAAELTASFAGTASKVYSHSLTGFIVETTAAEAAQMSRDPRVKTIQEDVPIYAAETQTGATWGLDRIDQRYLPLKGNYNYDATGVGIDVYVIDSGIRGTHTEFGGRVVYDFDAIGDGQNGYDCYGHGTHVAGTIAGATFGVAKQATLHSMRVLNCTGGGSVVGLLDAVEWLTANVRSPAVVNISITASAPITVIDDAINTSVASGLTYVVAAANNNADACGFTPGRAADAITVGATSQTDARPAFSNYGPCVDIFAPGTGIYSAGIADDASVAIRSGTSMSSPHVAGAAAILLETDPLMSPHAVEQAILATSTSGLITNGGEGSPDRLLYTGFRDPTEGTIDNVSIGGSVAYVGSSVPITWSNRGDYNSRVTIELSTNGGISFDSTIAADVSNSGVFSWSVPYTPTAGARVRVRESGETVPSAVSPTSFSISYAPTSADVSVMGRAAFNGNGVAGAIISFTDDDGNAVSTRSNSFGYFSIDLRAGRGYVVTTKHRRHRFAILYLEVNDDVSGLEILADD